MSARRFGGAGLTSGVAAGLVLLVALALIGVGLMRMTASSEAVPFRNACQGDDACRQALAERLPALQAAPGGAVASVHAALARSAPLLAQDASLAPCQATGAPESCVVDPAKLKAGEAGALIAVLDADSLAQARQARACRYLEGCAARALAALGEYGFDPLRLQGALQRTSYPLPAILKPCPDASPDAVRDACDAERLLRAAPEPLTVALEQDWRSGGAQVRLPRPPDPKVGVIKNALWAALGGALGVLALGSIWAGTAFARRPSGKGGLTRPRQTHEVATGAPDMSAQGRRSVFDPGVPVSPFPETPAPARAAAPTPPAVSQTSPPTAPGRGVETAPPPRRPVQRTTAPVGEEAAAPSIPPRPELAAFQAALALHGSVSTFARLADEAGGRLSPRLDAGERLASGAILAAHRLRGDRPADAHAGAYQDLVLGLAGPGHRLIWPRPGDPITAEMDTSEDGDLYSHTVEAVVRPGLADGSGALLLRPRVRGR